MAESNISAVYLLLLIDDNSVVVKYEEPDGAYQKLREGISINALNPFVVSLDDLSWRSPSIS